MKKLIAIILCVFLAVSLFPLSAAAEGTMAFRVISTQAKPGETVKVEVVVENNPGMAATSFDFQYDTSRLKLTEVAPNKTDFAGVWTTTLLGASWLATDGDTTAVGTIVTLTFEVLENAEAGDAKVELVVSEVSTYDFDLVEFESIPGVVTVGSEEPAAPTLEIYGTSISLSGAIGLNVYVKPNDEQIADEGFTVKLNGQAFPLKDTYDEKTGLSRFSLSLRAKQMGTPVTITAADGEGNAVQLVRAKNDYIPEDSWTCSIVEYVEKTVEAGTPENLVNLVKAMSTYGNMAQTALSYTDFPAPKAYPMDDVTADMVSKYQAKATAGEATGVQYVGCSVVLDSETDLGIYLKADDGRNLTEFTYTVNGKNATLTETKQGTCVMVSNISAKNLDRVYTIVVKDGDKTVLTVKASAMSYVYGALTSTAPTITTEIVNAAKALYLYSEAANTYWG